MRTGDLAAVDFIERALGLLWFDAVTAPVALSNETDKSPQSEERVLMLADGHRFHFRVMGSVESKRAYLESVAIVEGWLEQ